MRAVYLKDKNGNKLVSVPYYRVGDLFLTTIATNPSSYLGGKWELFGPGRCLVCVDTSQSEFNSVKKTGGSKTVTLNVNQIPAHTHSAWLNNSGGHEHIFWFGGGANSGNGGQIPVANSRWGQDKAGQTNGAHDHGGISVANTGGNQSHNNLQPFITCYVWIRTA